MRGVLVAAVLAAGCAGKQSAPTTSTTPPAAKVNLSGYPVEFRQGYADGCASAKPNAARKRDEVRFKSDTNYMQGWRDGHDICQRQK